MQNNSDLRIKPQLFLTAKENKKFKNIKFIIFRLGLKWNLCNTF